MPRIVITASSFCKNEILRAEALAAFVGSDVVFHPLDPKSSPLEVAAVLNGFDGAIVGREPICQEVVLQPKPPWVIAKYGVGMDNIDPAVLSRIKVIATPGSNAFSVAEHTIGLILSLAHNIAKCDRLLREGLWWKDGGTVLSGKTVAVIGVGHVGSRVVRLLRAFDCRVIGVDVTDKSALLAELTAQQMDLWPALGSADIVTLHVPLTEMTSEMVDEAFLASMRPGSWLINTSRGEIVVEAALLKALNSGRLAGAGLDVFEVEPTENKEMICHDRVVCTPHTAGNSCEAVLAMGRASISKLVNYIKVL